MAKRDELSFLELIQTFRRGELLSELDDTLEDLLGAIKRTGGDGTLTLKLPFKLNKAGQLECVPVVEAKKPKKAIGTGIFFVTDDARLSRRDPSQDDLFDELAERRERADLQ